MIAHYQTLDSVDGYRGIWLTLGQPTEFGDKYSGGLGTYTANHIPMAVHAEQVNKIYVVYGGTRQDGERKLLAMIGVYDHDSHTARRPLHAKDPFYAF